MTNKHSKIEDRFHIHVFIRSSNIWLLYIHSRLNTVRLQQFKITKYIK